MVKKYSAVEKHDTKIQTSNEDFVKHDCPNKLTVWKKGKKEDVAIVLKQEFSEIKGNENMVPVNARAADACPFCDTDITDNSFVPCTKEDVEALSK